MNVFKKYNMTKKILIFDDGDSNRSFFHTRFNGRSMRNYTLSLHIRNVWLDGVVELRQEVAGFLTYKF